MTAGSTRIDPITCTRCGSTDIRDGQCHACGFPIEAAAVAHWPGPGTTIQLRLLRDASDAELDVERCILVGPRHRDLIARDRHDNLYRVRVREGDAYRQSSPLPADLQDRIALPVAVGEWQELRLVAWHATDHPTLAELAAEYGGRLSIAALAEFIRPVSELMQRMHRHGFAAGCLLPTQLTIDDEGLAQIIATERVYRLGQRARRVEEHPGHLHPALLEPTTEARWSMDTELFSLGALCWSLLTGQPPAVSAMTSWYPVLPLRAWRPDLPPGVTPVLEAATTPYPTAMWSSPKAFMRDLQTVADSIRALDDAPATAVEVVAETHTGINKRRFMPVNQDAIFAESLRGEFALIGVADGVSTADFGTGDIASHLLREEARKAWSSFDERALETHEERVAWLQDIIDAANKKIIDFINDRYAPFSGDVSRVMASTIVLGLIAYGRATVVSAGDSSAFLLRDNALERLNRDHNVLTLSIVQGGDPDEALNGTWPEALANCVGNFELEHDGRLAPISVELDAVEFPLVPGDILLFCTDGLTDYVADHPDIARERIRQILIQEEAPSIAALELIVAANRGGGGDNVSVALCAATGLLDPMAFAEFDDEAPP